MRYAEFQKMYLESLPQFHNDIYTKLANRSDQEFHKTMLAELYKGIYVAVSEASQRGVYS